MEEELAEVVVARDSCAEPAWRVKKKKLRWGSRRSVMAEQAWRVASSVTPVAPEADRVATSDVASGASGGVCGEAGGGVGGWACVYICVYICIYS